MEAVRTKYVFSVDVDFVLMKGTYERLMRDLPVLEKTQPKRSAFIVPAFDFVPPGYHFGCTGMGNCTEAGKSNNNNNDNNGNNNNNNNNNNNDNNGNNNNNINNNNNNNNNNNDNINNGAGVGAKSDSRRKIKGSSESGDSSSNIIISKNGLDLKTFELPDVAVLSTKSGLFEKIVSHQAKPAMARGKPSGHADDSVSWNPGHVDIVNYDKWYLATEPYEAVYTSFFNEPYVVVAMDDPCLPGYDERFYSYGGDKTEFFNHLYALKYKLVVLPNVYMYHLPHYRGRWETRGPEVVLRNYKLWLTVMKERGVHPTDDIWSMMNWSLRVDGFNETQRLLHEQEMCSRR